jgi:DNA-binding NarL/FixJ family response regulator
MLARRLASSPNVDVVGSTGDSEEGLRQIKELAPDVVLLDTKMRNANGMDVCRRACAVNGKAKVAVLTSYGDLEERRSAYKLGASGYLLKEVGTQMLVARLRRMVGLNE